ncbi:sugar ABC transporter substrate-binding protein [Streptomyces sp. NPDC056716]|uniref:sugar ABC transporter substrate-binding protein n=1 Tax=unclassified Streptomyces TaxID=2593676 RepID=UPI00368E2510
MNIVAEDIANWNKDEALTLMEDWVLAHPGIDAIVSMNDNMAAGALEAVAGRDTYRNIQSYGVDGTPEASLLIQDGQMTATSLQSASEPAKLNMEAVHALLTGAEESVQRDIDAPLITSENAADHVSMYREAGFIDD